MNNSIHNPIQLDGINRSVKSNLLRQGSFMLLFIIMSCFASLSYSGTQTSTQPVTTPIAHQTDRTDDFDNSYLVSRKSLENSPIVKYGLLLPLYIILFILALYVVRHYLLTINRLFGKQHNLYAEVIEANWPSVTILVAAHNEEAVITDLLLSILKIDYPTELLQVIIINDRSTDGTGTIIDDFVTRNPGRFTHYYRHEGVPGKSAALFDVMSMVENSITLVFDADYMPGTFLIKQLVSPFFDPEVGSVMGRVVPGNTEKNLLTRLIDIERAGGYQVNQQARENWHAVPQYGGTAGGLRTQALMEVGGWNKDILAEDTEITFRLLANNWITVYQNNAECIEMAPETWPVRIRQIKRWSKGHNQVMYHYLFKTLFDKQLSPLARYDGVLLLATYLISPLLLIGWVLLIVAYFLDVVPAASGVLGFLIIISFSGAGNFTVFYEIGTALHLDNLQGVEGNRIRLLPLIYMSFFVSMFAITKAFIEQITVDRFRKGVVWVRTDHPSRDKSKIQK